MCKKTLEDKIINRFFPGWQWTYPKLPKNDLRSKKELRRIEEQQRERYQRLNKKG